MLRRTQLAWSMVLVLFAAGAVAQVIPNWPAPATWTPPRAGHGVTPMSDLTNPMPFVAVTPCRLYDNRANSPFTGDSTFNTDNQTENIDFYATTPQPYAPTGNPNGCTLPPVGAAGAWSLKFTYRTISAAQGVLTAFPGNLTTIPGVGTILGASDRLTSGAAIVPAGVDAHNTINVWAQYAANTIVIDYNGYFANGQVNPGESFGFTSNHGTGGVIYGSNTATTATGAYGGNFLSSSNGDGSAGVHGEDDATPSGSAVVAGVFGETANTGNSVAGVRGRSGSALTPSATYAGAGVRGESTGGFGVFGGTVSGYGTVGYKFTAASGGTLQAGGYLGFNTTDGVHAYGNVTATGSKQFVEPHATDPSKVIKYISLEGNEAGTYFRGTGQFRNRVATIEVPEDFRMVTDADGLTIQVTPVGEFANVAVTSIGLDRITLKATRDVEFFFMVNGVRRAYRDHQPIQEDPSYYVPTSPDATMPASLSEEVKRRLISNGTYTEDGRVNMETAKRFGWDKAWEARARQAAAQH